MSVKPRPLLVKVDATRYRQDTVAAQLIEAGFQVVKATSVKEGIKLARRCKPDFIIAVDNLKVGLDAAAWLASQHADSEPTLAMTPLLIIASEQRASRLRIHELPDRVRVLAAPVSPNELIQTLRQILAAWSF